MKFRTALAVITITLAALPAAASGRAEGAIVQSWDEPAGLKAVVIEADEQDIVVKAGGERIRGRVLGDRSDDVKVTKKNGVLTVTIRSDRGWLFGRHRASRVELTVPEGTDLDLTTASGAILVQVKAGQLKARTASGDIEAARGASSADADSSSGTVRISGVEGDVRASTLSGDVRLEDLRGLVQASSLSGTVEGTNLHLESGSRFSTVSGDVRLRLPGSLDDFTVSAETSSGSLQIGNQHGEDRMTAGQGSKTLTAKSVSGDIQIR